MVREYKLFLKKYDGEKIIINKSRTIEDMDNYTNGFIGYNDLISDRVGKDYLEYKIFLESNFKEKVEYLPILFSTDKFDSKEVRELYLNFLKSKRFLIDKSLIKNVNIGVEVNRYMNNRDLERCVYAYFKNYPYKVVRDAYFALVYEGIIKRYISNDIIDRYTFEKYTSDTDDYFLSTLIAYEDFDNIYKYYDLDNLSRRDRDYLTGKFKVRSRK